MQHLVGVCMLFPLNGVKLELVDAEFSLLMGKLIRLLVHYRSYGWRIPRREWLKYIHRPSYCSCNLQGMNCWDVYTTSHFPMVSGSKMHSFTWSYILYRMCRGCREATVVFQYTLILNPGWISSSLDLLFSRSAKIQFLLPPFFLTCHESRLLIGLLVTWLD